METIPTELQRELDSKINYGNSLIDKLSSISKIEGVPKVQRKIKQEINFLKKLKSSKNVKRDQLSSSNLRHLAAIVECALRPGVLSVNKVLNLSDGSKITIDVISENCTIWTKVIARNPKSLSALSEGNSSYGMRSILDQAKDYLECAKLHPHLYQTPQVVFEFVSGIEDLLAKKLQNIGITVKGELVHFDRLKNESLSSNQDEDDDDDDINKMISTFCINKFNETKSRPTELSISENTIGINVLNLDVTTMMAYVSNLTNGHYNYVFKQPLLSQQAEWEAKRPVKPILDSYFKDKTLVCCQAAWDDFMKIIRILGGPNEKSRASDLEKRLIIMPNDKNGPDESIRAELKVKGRVRLRSKIIFNFGQRIHAVTVSANDGFVRSAKQQGIAYAAIIHESRALTEVKESTATPRVLS